MSLTHLVDLNVIITLFSHFRLFYKISFSSANQRICELNEIKIHATRIYSMICLNYDIQLCASPYRADRRLYTNNLRSPEETQLRINTRHLCVKLLNRQ